MEEKKVVPNSDLKVVFSLFETVKLSVSISQRNLLYFIEKHKRKPVCAANNKDADQPAHLRSLISVFWCSLPR